VFPVPRIGRGRFSTEDSAVKKLVTAVIPACLLFAAVGCTEAKKDAPKPPAPKATTPATDAPTAPAAPKPGEKETAKPG
jgi:hypothetical protein